MSEPIARWRCSRCGRETEFVVDRACECGCLWVTPLPAPPRAVRPQSLARERYEAAYRTRQESRR